MNQQVQSKSDNSLAMPNINEFIVFDFSKLFKIVNTLCNKVDQLEEGNEKLLLSFQSFKEKQSLDLLRTQIDDKVGHINVGISNINGKIMQLEDKSTFMHETIARMQDSIEKLKLDSKKDDEPTLKKSSSIVMENYLGEKFEKKYTEDFEKLQTAFETRLYDIECRIDEMGSTTPVKRDETSPPKTRISSTSLTPFGKLFSAATQFKIDPNNGSELHQYAAFLQKEIEIFKQMVESGVKASVGDNTTFADQVTTYNERISKLENVLLQLAPDHDEHTNTLQQCQNNFKTLQKIIIDRLKVKLKLEGIEEIQDSENDLPPDQITPKKPVIVKSKFSSMLMIKENFIPATDPLKKQSTTNVSQGPQINLSIYATKDSLAKLEQSINLFSVNIANKIDQSVMTQSLAALKSEITNLSQNLEEIKKGYYAYEQDQISIRNFMEVANKEISIFKEKNEAINEKLSNIFNILKEVDSKMKQKVDYLDFSLIKDSSKLINSRFSKLYELLGYDEEKPGDPPTTLAQTIKVSIEALEHKLMEIEGLQNNDEEDKPSFNPIDDKPLESQKDVSSTPIVNKSDLGLRGKVERHERDIKELQTRMYEIEMGKQLREVGDDNGELLDLKKEIETVKHSYNELENIKARLSQKADIMEFGKFRENLDGFAKKIDDKLGKKDLEKSNAAVRVKLLDLARSVQSIKPKDETDPYPLCTYNNKCIFCNQGVAISPKVKQLIGTKYTDSEYLPKDQQFHLPKSGAGYSKLLSSLRNEWELEQLFPSAAKQELKIESVRAESSSKSQQRLNPISAKKKTKAKANEL